MKTITVAYFCVEVVLVGLIGTSVTTGFVVVTNSIHGLLHNRREVFTSPSTTTKSDTRTRTTTTTLRYWFCDPNDKSKRNEDNNIVGRIELECEELERAREAFESLLMDHTNDGIQNDGIVMFKNYQVNALSHSNSLTRTAVDVTTGGNDVSTNDRQISSSAPFSGYNNIGSVPSTSYNFPMDDKTSELDMKAANYNTDRLLTNTGRSLRELEIKLLEQLGKSDDGSAEDALIHFWTTERDSHAANDLLLMAIRPCSENLLTEEIMLKTMTETYPTWAEPYSRLASLLYYRNQLHDAERMAEQALRLKPWHFEAIRMMVLISIQLGKNSAAIGYGAKLLPRMTRTNDEDDDRDMKTTVNYKELRNMESINKQLRQTWVERAIMDAKAQLHELEMYTKQYQEQVSRTNNDLRIKQQQHSFPSKEFLRPEEIWQ